VKGRRELLLKEKKADLLQVATRKEGLRIGSTTPLEGEEQAQKKVYRSRDRERKPGRWPRFREEGPSSSLSLLDGGVIEEIHPKKKWKPAELVSHEKKWPP